MNQYDIQNDTQNVQSTPKKNLTPIIGAAIALVVLLIIVIICCNSCSSDAEDTAIGVVFDEDGNAYIAQPDGTVTELGDDIKTARMTSDRKHIVVTTNDGELYVTDDEGEDKEVIADKEATTADINEYGVIYYTSKEIEETGEYGYVNKTVEKTYFRYLFDDATSTELGTDINLTTSEELAVIFADDGDIKVMPSDETEASTIASYNKDDERVSLYDVSDDADVAAWTVTKTAEGKQTLSIFVYEDEEEIEIESYDLGSEEYANLSMVFTEDYDMLVVADYLKDKIYIKENGEDAVSVKLDGLQRVTTGTMYGISKTDSGDIDGLYAIATKDGEDNLHYITIEGEKTKVLSDVSGFVIRDDIIVYESDGKLYYNTIDGEELGDERIRISSDVNDYTVTADGKYVYFEKEDGDDDLLMAYEIGDEDPIEVTDDMYSIEAVTVDGDVLFLADKSTDNNGVIYGTLMVWSFGDDKPEKISDEYVSGSITSKLSTGEIDLDDCLFAKHDEVKEKEKTEEDYTTKYSITVGDLMHYDGDAESIISGYVIYTAN